MDYDKSCQFLLLGNSEVGKTSLIRRYTNGLFKEEYISTIGIDYDSKKEIIDDINVQVKLWDTAGQERFRAITPNNLRNAEGIMLVFDITNSDSFNGLKDWLESIKTHFGEKNISIPIIIVGNKIDLEDKRDVEKDDANKFAQENNFKYFETSAKTGEGVDNAVRELVRQILANKDSEDSGEKNNKIKLQDNKKDNQKKKGCC